MPDFISPDQQPSNSPDSNTNDNRTWWDQCSKSCIKQRSMTCETLDAKLALHWTECRWCRRCDWPVARPSDSMCLSSDQLRAASLIGRNAVTWLCALSTVRRSSWHVVNIVGFLVYNFICPLNFPKFAYKGLVWNSLRGFRLSIWYLVRSSLPNNTLQFLPRLKVEIHRNSI